MPGSTDDEVLVREDESQTVTGPIEAPGGEGPVDPAVPPPSGLSTYVQLLSEWARERPPSDPFLIGLLSTKRYGDQERREFLAGAAALWSLVPPITAPEIEEADLSADSARALALALELRGWHALHHHLPGPGPLPGVIREVAEMTSVLQLVLDGQEQPGTRSERRLVRLVEALGERGAATGRLADRKEDVRDTLTRRRADEEHARRDAERQAEEDARPPANPLVRLRRVEVPVGQLLIIAGALGLSPVLYKTMTPPPSGGLPPASAYVEVPVLGLIRETDRVTARVQPDWVILPAADRAAGARRLFDRLSAESGGALRELVLRTRSDTELAVVGPAAIHWKGPFSQPADPPTPPPAPPTPEAVPAAPPAAPPADGPRVDAAELDESL